jgi:hypothetical protein
MRPPLFPKGIILAALWMLSGTAALATAVNGRVTTTSGQGIAGVNLDFIDRATGTNILLSNDTTDILGFYSVSVPPGSYDVRFKPPLGTRFVGIEIRGVTVQGASLVLDQVLPTGWMITGRVLDDTSTPVPSTDLDVIDAATRNAIFTNHDTSDTAGNFNVVVPAGVYTIEFTPPATTTLVPARMEGVSVTSDVSLGTVVLRHGLHLGGDVQATDGTAAPNVTLRVLEPATAKEVFTLNNRTDGAGHFEVLVAPATYNLRFEPAQAAPLVPRTVVGVSVASDRVLPPVTLDAGVTAFGRVEDVFGNKIKGVDLDFINVFSGVKQFTPHDNTDDNGDYAVTVRSGTYDVTFDPPAGSGMAPQRLTDVLMSTDQSLPNVSLPRGFVVSGVVRDGALNAGAGVDLDFIDLATGLQILTARDDSDVTGAFAVVVPAATYEIHFTPPDASGSGVAILPPVVVGSDVSLGTVTLPGALPASPLAVSPSSGNASGGTLLTLTGSGFAPGVVVKVGGVTLSQILRLDSGTVQGFTRARPAGTVDVQVINPGAAAAVLPGAFTCLPTASDPGLTVSASGPVGNDVLLQWTATPQGRYTVYRSTSPTRFTDLERIDVIEATTFLLEGELARPGNSFYVVQ